MRDVVHVGDEALPEDRDVRGRRGREASRHADHVERGTANDAWLHVFPPCAREQRGEVERRIAVHGREQALAAESSRRDPDVAREGARERRLGLEAAAEREVHERLLRLHETVADVGQPALAHVAGGRLAGQRREHAMEVPGRAGSRAGDRHQRELVEETGLDEVDRALQPDERVVHRRGDSSAVIRGGLCSSCAVGAQLHPRRLPRRARSSPARARCARLAPRPVPPGRMARKETGSAVTS